MWEPVLGTMHLLAVAGNHEIPGSADGSYTPYDIPSSFGYNSAGHRFAYQAFAMRLPQGQRPASQLGDIYSQLYWAHSVGPVAVIGITNYLSFAVGTPQYQFVLAALAAIDRTATPWVR